MNTTYKTFILAGTLAVLPAFNSCVLDELHDTPYPEAGAVTITADWTARGPGIAIPDAWNIALGDYSGTETGTTHSPDYLFEPGNYTLVAWNPAENIAVSGTTATVAAVSADTLCPTPEWLFASVQSVAIAADSNHAFSAQMLQQVRQLTLTIMPIGETAEKMMGMECTLTGVAGSMDFAAGTYGNESVVPLHFEQITEGENAGAWTVTVYLLGIVGERQYLSGYATFADGNPQPLFIESDMTEVLCEEFDHFNDFKSDPKLLSTWLKVSDQAGFSGTIVDWQTGNGEQVDLH